MSQQLESLLTQSQRLQADIGDTLQRINLRALKAGQWLRDNAAPREADDELEDMVMCLDEAERAISLARQLLANAGLPGDRNYEANKLAARSLMTEASGFLAEDK